MAQQQLTDEQKLEQQYQSVKKRQEEGGGFSQALGEGRLPLQKGVFTPMRFVGMPEEVFYSFIIGDDGKWKYFTFPDKEKDPTFILFKIMNKVLERDYMGKDSSGNPIFNYHHQESFPDIFNMVYNNGFKEIGKYGPNGWGSTSGNPSRAMVANVINRAPFTLTFKNDQGQEVTKTYGEEHCKETGHTLLLVKDSKSSIAPITIYEELLTKVFPVKGTFWKFDVAIKKLGAKPWYSIITSSDIKEGVKNNAPEMMEIGKYVKDGEYPEEQKYQRHDLADMIKPVSSQFVYDNLKIKISQIDNAFGTHFLEEIEDSLVKTPSGATPAPAQKAAKEEIVPEKEENTPAQKVETPADTDAPVARARRAPAATGNPANVDVVAPFYKDLAPEEQSLITGVQNGKIVYSSEAGALLPCPNPQCTGPKEGQPENIATLCIYCGQKFQ